MRLVVSQPAVDLIQERGGRLYVWLKRSGCCGAITRLTTSSEPSARVEFRRVPVSERFELFVPAGLGRLPEELHIELQRFPRRVEAYWNGCAWVI